jgi:hypothetical protein
MCLPDGEMMDPGEIVVIGGPREEVVEIVEEVPHIIIIEAWYHVAHAEIPLVRHYRNGLREFRADNGLWGDPSPGQFKSLRVIWECPPGVRHE